jgi:hypothetical protein
MTREEATKLLTAQLGCSPTKEMVDECLAQAAEFQNAQRIKREKAICLRLVRDALKAGYVVSVNDGGDDVLVNSSSFQAIVAAMFSTDEDVLTFRDPRVVVDVARKLIQRVGFVHLVYGNDCDVISDGSTGAKMDNLLAGANEVADRLSVRS